MVTGQPLACPSEAIRFCGHWNITIRFIEGADRYVGIGIVAYVKEQLGSLVFVHVLAISRPKP